VEVDPMQAAVVNVRDQAPKYQSFADPVPQEGEALVHVRAAGLHPLVRGLASGTHYASGGEGPAIPGVDGVGTLDDGRRVWFVFVRRPWGAMAERAAAPRDKLISVPDGLDDATAAAIGNPGMSSWLALKMRAQVAAGETVLIMGATGVAGQLAIQMARYLGAKRVIAAGRNVEALAGAKVGAVIALDQPEDAIREALTKEAARGVDVVADYLWGRPTELVLEALAKGFRPESTQRTRLVEIGSSAGPTITLPSATLRSIDLTLLGSGFGAVPLDGVLAAITTVFDLAAKRILTIDVEPVPLAQVEVGWNRAEKGRRIVFTM
jgi:NADPH:quinone reductase-like Zn-dependent oxidoreductase